MPGKLILLPNTLDGGSHLHLPLGFEEILKSLDGLIAETPKVARRLIKKFSLKMPLQEFPIETLSKHTKGQEINELLYPIEKGEIWGMMSDQGLPCIADPGSCLVKEARKKNLSIEALSGPSSLTLLMMLSGLPSQSFTFHSYLPREEEKLIQRLNELSNRSKNEHSTQVFIETPFRNERMLDILLKALPNETTLALGIDLTKEEERVLSKKVSSWKRDSRPKIHKRPVIFAFYS